MPNPFDTKDEFYLDSIIPNLSAEAVKRMVRFWGEKNITRKAEGIEYLKAALSSPDRIRALIESLEPYQQLALSLLKQYGNDVNSEWLAILLLVSGNFVVNLKNYNQNVDAILEPLVQVGLILTSGSYDHLSLSRAYSYKPKTLYADARILEHVKPIELPPMTLAEVNPSSRQVSRRPQSVILDLIGIMQAIELQGGLELTKAGVVKVRDLRLLKKNLRWGEELDLDGLIFPDPAEAFLSALIACGILVDGGNRLTLSETTDRIASHPYESLIRDIMKGFISLKGWIEGRSVDHDYYYMDNYNLARMSLIILLTRLPSNDTSFHSLQDLDLFLYERIGRFFTLYTEGYESYHHGNNSDAAQKKREEARKNQWLLHEGLWLKQAMSTWLYALGLVELGVEEQKPSTFRLTPLGKSVLHPELANTIETVPETETPAWVIQPNFEIMVYLDRATPGQLAFIERHAERMQAQQHTYHYQLTHESVYLGLENGTEPDSLIRRLKAGSLTEMPQNVEAELREWIASRERIALHRQVRLLEYPDPAARDSALAGGLEGTAIGDRYLLWKSPESPDEKRETPPLVMPASVIDYLQPLPKRLIVTEEGEIRLNAEPGDLLIESQIDRWADRLSDKTWKFSAARMAAAMRSGGRYRELIQWLDQRQSRPLPKIVQIALRAWSGEKFSSTLAPVVILRCAHPDVMEAILHSSSLKPSIKGSVAPDTLLVEEQGLEKIKSTLVWAGIDVSDTVKVTGRNR